jgi:hypothetical protein
VQQNKKLIEKEKSEMIEIQNESGGYFSCTNLKFINKCTKDKIHKKRGSIAGTSFFNAIVW